MFRMKPWIAGTVSSTVAFSVGASGLFLALGNHVIKEFTRPGVAVEKGSPFWGNWGFPTENALPPEHLLHALTFTSADGNVLRGDFWAQPQPAPTVIISHGFHLPRQNFIPVAALMYSHGSNVLLFDYRGHGESALIPTTCGNAEVNDLIAAVNIAAQQPETIPGRVYIHGFSMGAAVAILMPPHPAVAGIIADSPYARLDDMIHKIIVQHLQSDTSQWRGPSKALRSMIPAFSHMMLAGSRIAFRMRYRKALVAFPERTISAHARARNANQPILPPILLIHAERDPMIPLGHAHKLMKSAQKAKRSIQSYFTPSEIHCGSYGHDPEQYVALLLGFIGLA